MSSELVGCKGRKTRKASLFTSLKRLEINFQTLGKIKDINKLTPPAERGQHIPIRPDTAARAATHSLAVLGTQDNISGTYSLMSFFVGGDLPPGP